ncbi:phosphoribosyltransferase [Desulfatibacillum aliphaticivorans]|uniref:phosphoribosyltransferase n=1 Tax=Desulfatibacillum aliphaticivorans TaxID=218208 RepID=UPI00040245DE|nr:phosphoribosyltransferase [Desulfatibacillum aliphaticivorans]
MDLDAMQYGFSSAKGNTPKIVRSRDRLDRYHLNFPSEDGSYSFYLKKDTYPQLFQLHHGDIVEKADCGWHGTKMKGLRFRTLSDMHQEIISKWCLRFNRYVLIGLNKHIENAFKNELDFCMALDFHVDKKNDKRTKIGEAEYCIKYHELDLPIAARNDAKTFLFKEMLQGLSDLPPTKNSPMVSTIPSNEQGKKKLAWRIAEALAKEKSLDFVEANLLCERQSLKGIGISEKIPVWDSIYKRKECIKVSHDVAGASVVVIDDLYMSGVTIWSYAKYLKSLGAAQVLGLVLVKSLKDTGYQ